MTLKLITIAVLLHLAPPQPGQTSDQLVFVQSSAQVLNSEQVGMLLTGTQITFQPAGAPGRHHMSFESGGKLGIRAYKGKSRSGTWSIAEAGVVCLKNAGVTGGKDFCATLKRVGNQIHVYSTETGKKVKSSPWTIAKEGPKAAQVPKS